MPNLGLIVGRAVIGHHSVPSSWTLRWPNFMASYGPTLFFDVGLVSGEGVVPILQVHPEVEAVLLTHGPGGGPKDLLNIIAQNCRWARLTQPGRI